MDSCYVDFCEGFCSFLRDKPCIQALIEVNLCFTLCKLIEKIKPMLQLLCVLMTVLFLHRTQRKSLHKTLRFQQACASHP